MMPVRDELSNGTKVWSERFDFWWVVVRRQASGW